MRHALVSKLSLGLLGTWLSSAIPPGAHATPAAPPLLASSHGLIQPKQPVPDDPLAGLPGDDTGDDSADPNRKGSSDGRKGTRTCQLEATPSDAREVGDPRATLAFVLRGPRSWPCSKGGSRISELRLRVSIDGSGKITAAERAAGDVDLANIIAKRLLGQSTPPHTTGATTGLVVLTLLPGKR